MKIEKNKVVSIDMKLSDEHGTLLEATSPDEPIAYLQGYNNILAALEEQLEGMSAGENCSVTLKPEEAYGNYVEDAVQRISKKHLQGASQKLKVGDFVTLESDQGRVQGCIIKAGKFMMTVDLNHPYAGIQVTFDITVKDIRDASEEELAHGHAHGVGGHHH